MRLDDLVKNVEQMSMEELQALVREIRRDRQTSKKPQRSASTKTRAKKADSIKGILAGMTPEQRAQLMIKLAGG